MGQVIAELQKEGMDANDISEDELAKAHGRYMVGGCQEVEHERVFRFGQYDSKLATTIRLSQILEFPERPGALRRFLQELRSDWNISLFHYRNHGAGMSRR